MAFPVKFAGGDYDLKKFLRDHPGGVNTLKKYEGKSIGHAMKLYEHSNGAYHMLSDFKIKSNDNNLTGSVSGNGRIITKEEVEWESQEIAFLEELEILNMPRCQSSEEWERKKSYLIRGLFEDLSPIQEEEDPSLSFISGELRAESPLPDLIIEIEPKKPNPCDESEEFYKKLFKEMRWVYHRDHYLAPDSSNSLDSLKSFKENENRLNILAELSRSDNEDLHSLQELEFINKRDHINYTKAELEESTIQNKFIERYLTSGSKRSFNSDNNYGFEKIQTQAEVYTYEDKELYENFIQVEQRDNNSMEDTQKLSNKRCSETISPAESCYKSVQKRFETFTSIENCKKKSVAAFKSCTANLEMTRHEIVVDSEENEDEEEVEEEEIEEEVIVGEEEYEGLAISCDTSHTPVSDSEGSRHFSPEAMRQGRHYASIESLLMHDMSKTDSNGINKSIDIQPMEIEEAIISYGPKEAAASPSYLNTYLSTSTPKSERKSKMISRKYRRRLTCYSSSSISLKSAGAQTSFSDEDPDWSRFWNQFFVGTPTIYNLCSCENHICSSNI